MSSQKRLSLWPLPGGVENYFDNLLRCLDFVDKNKPDRLTLRRWFIDTYKLSGQKVMDGYIHVVEEELGLIVEVNGKLSLTDDGKTVLQGKDKMTVFEVLNRRIIGVGEILALLKDRPNTLNELHSLLLSKLTGHGVRWGTKAQTNWRVGWLRSLDMITKSGRTLTLTELGKSKLTKIGEVVEPPHIPEEEPTSVIERKEEQMTHNRLRELIAELGKLEGKFAEVEYPIDNLRLDVVWKTIRAGNPKWVFEIQLFGNFFEALTKLKHAWDLWNSKPFLVTTSNYIEQAKQLIEGSFHEMRNDARLVEWKKMRALYEHSKKSSEIKEEIRL